MVLTLPHTGHNLKKILGLIKFENHDKRTTKISICSRNGLAIMELIPRQMPFQLKKGDLAPGFYFVQCIDKYGRIPSEKMTIKGETAEEPE
jgi:hypothetical protein